LNNENLNPARDYDDQIFADERLTGLREKHCIGRDSQFGCMMLKGPFLAEGAAETLSQLA
jgi:hypothetical protein